jgi:hypothetical protein
MREGQSLGRCRLRRKTRVRSSSGPFAFPTRPMPRAFAISVAPSPSDFNSRTLSGCLDRDWTTPYRRPQRFGGAPKLRSRRRFVSNVANTLSMSRKYFSRPLQPACAVAAMKVIGASRGACCVPASCSFVRWVDRFGHNDADVVEHGAARLAARQAKCSNRTRRYRSSPRDREACCVGRCARWCSAVLSMR